MRIEHDITVTLNMREYPKQKPERNGAYTVLNKNATISRRTWTNGYWRDVDGESQLSVSASGVTHFALNGDMVLQERRPAPTGSPEQ